MILKSLEFQCDFDFQITTSKVIWDFDFKFTFI